MKTTRIFCLIFFACFFLAQPLLATSCSTRPLSGNHSITDACSFPHSVDGVDSGSGTTNTAVLTIANGGSLTVGVGTTLAVGSISLIDGSIISISGIIKIGTPLYMQDADADGYTANTAVQYITASSGRVRRNTLVTLASADCNDTNANVDTLQYSCDTCYDQTCNPSQVCGQTCSGGGACNGCSCVGNACGQIWNPQHTCYCNYCATNTNPHDCNCSWRCV